MVHSVSQVSFLLRMTKIRKKTFFSTQLFLKTNRPFLRVYASKSICEKDLSIQKGIGEEIQKITFKKLPRMPIIISSLFIFKNKDLKTVKILGLCNTVLSASHPLPPMVLI